MRRLMEVFRLWMLLLPLALLLPIREKWSDGAFAFKDQNMLLLGKPHLQFGGWNKAFKIAIMADLHYGETAWTDWGPEQDVKSTLVQDFILDAEKPDFVIYLGDQVTANNVIAGNSSKYWIQSMTPASRRSIPHASVFGNHDDAFMVYDDNWFGPSGIPGLPSENVGYYHGTTREDIKKAEMEMRTSLTQSGPRFLWPSMSNYVITITSAKFPGNIAALLYFMDSGGGTYPEVVSASQAAWFKATSSNINPSGCIPELVFFHIPTKAYQKIGPTPRASIEHPCVGSINFERPATQAQERGLMDVLTRRKSVKAVFTGHNHGLDWCCPCHDLWLCYARHTGYGGYGNWIRGSRILELVEEPDFSIKSWITLENGKEVAEINLV